MVLDFITDVDADKSEFITNYARNNTLILNGCFFSIQVLLCLYSMSSDTGTEIGNLPRTAFVSTDRQSDENAYLMCSKEVRRTLKFHEWLTFQRYPDVYAGPKSSFQQPLQEISQVFVNKNGEIFVVEKGVVSALSHSSVPEAGHQNTGWVRFRGHIFSSIWHNNSNKGTKEQKYWCCDSKNERAYVCIKLYK